MVALPRSPRQDWLHRPHTDIVMRGNVILLMWVLSAAVLSAPHQHKEPVVMAPGYGPLSFTPKKIKYLNAFEIKAMLENIKKSFFRAISCWTDR